MVRLGWFLTTALMACQIGAVAHAQAPVRIGVLTDMSGPHSDYTGGGAVEAARMASADFGDAVLDRTIEVTSADHQNKPDIGSAIANQWLGSEDVGVMVDIPLSSVDLAVQDIARRDNRIVLFSSRATSDLSGNSARCTR